MQPLPYASLDVGTRLYVESPMNQDQHGMFYKSELDHF